MNNNPNCKKRCLDCYHCDYTCNLDCRDCHLCTTYTVKSKEKYQITPRDFYLLTRRDEANSNVSNSTISEVQSSDSYVPIPLYCQSKKCIKKPTKQEYSEIINNTDVSLCYFGDPQELMKKRKVLPTTQFSGSLLFSQAYNDITTWSV